MITKNRAVEPITTYEYLNLLFRIRAHWRDLETWTRAYLVSRFVGVGYFQEVFARLYNVPQEIGGTVGLIFGNEIANEYIQLLSTHIRILRDYIEAAVAGDVSTANARYRDLYQNSDERASFLARINPFWKETEWRNLLYTYLSLTFEEITSFLTGNYKTNINIFDRILAHTETMGDYFARGMYDYLTYRNNMDPVAAASRCRPCSMK